MLALIFFLIILPVLALAYLPKLAKKYFGRAVAEDIRRLYAKHPVEKGRHRVLRDDRQGKRMLGDFETQMEAVDRAYLGKEAAAKAGESASFLVLNDQGEVLQRIGA